MENTEGHSGSINARSGRDRWKAADSQLQSCPLSPNCTSTFTLCVFPLTSTIFLLLGTSPSLHAPPRPFISLSLSMLGVPNLCVGHRVIFAAENTLLGQNLKR
eukprot:1339245-Amorphochlora_amoeboformis.AAC.2